MVIFTLGLIIRKCIISKHGSCCPDWVTEQCKCQCSSNDAEEGCISRCATASNCFKYPSKQQFLDSCCPTKQWCDDTFCCCMSEQPSGQCCKWDDCCSDMNCGSCFDCPDCKDCCDDCKCECCSQPETIDCCCIEVKLAGNRGPGGPPQQGGYPMHGYGGQMSGYGGPMPGGYGQMPGAGYPGGAYSGGGYNQGMPIQHQPSMMQHAPGMFQPGPSGPGSLAFSQQGGMGGGGYSASQMMQPGAFSQNMSRQGSMMNSSMNNMGMGRSTASMFQGAGGSNPQNSTNA
uniref:Uncharacterized protein n=2 Tax=Clytia hemisphaerica TaxID=252671 RepID=A0A7M5UPA8_9CNID